MMINMGGPRYDYGLHNVFNYIGDRFFLYAIITAYFDGTLERLENKLYEKITSKPTTK